MSDLGREVIRMSDFTDRDDLLGLCGCGEPSLVLDAIRDLLEAISGVDSSRPDYDAQWNRSRKAQDALLGDRNKPYFWLMYYTLDRLGLTEHGSSVWLPMLEPRGERVLEALKKYGTDWQKWTDEMTLEW